MHAILPALTILVTAIGGWILTMRNNTISVLTEDYVRMARAKGLKPWRIMWTYAGRNAILPNLTGFAMSLGFVVAGAILVEYVFNYPGVGWMFLAVGDEPGLRAHAGALPADRRRGADGDPRRRRGDGVPRSAHAGRQMSASSVGATDQLATPPAGPAPMVAEARRGRWGDLWRAISRNQKAVVGVLLLLCLHRARDLPGPDRAVQPDREDLPAGARPVLAALARHDGLRAGHLLAARSGALGSRS